MLWLPVLVVLVLAVTLWTLPSVARPTLPLGVSVPSDRVHDPVVVGAVRAYRRSVLLATLVSCAGCAGLWLVSDTLAVLVGPLLVLALGSAALVHHRHAIVVAKHERDWYAGLPVRLVADLAPARRTPPPWGLYAVSLAVTLLGLGYGIAAYGRQPDPYPTHTGSSGEPDAWGAKTWWNVLGPQLLAIALVVGMALLAWGIGRAQPQIRPDGDLEAARRRDARMKRLTHQLLALSTLVLAVGMTALSVAGWQAWHGTVTSLLVGAFVVASLAPVAVLLVRASGAEQDQALEDYRRAREARARGEAPPTPDPQTPDDDAHWWGGMIYHNPDDPRTMVPKRMGLGWTVNASTPWGKALCGGTVLLIVGSVLLPLVVH